MAAQVVFNHFPQIAKNLEPVLGKVVRKTAFDIQANAASAAPVATGFLKNSIYVVTSNKSTYGRGIQVAGVPRAGKKGFVSRRQLQGFVKRKARQRQQESMIFNELAGTPGDPTTALVAVGATYGIYVEMGTRRMTAQPYFYPAVDAAKGPFEAALAAIEPSLVGGVSGEII